MTARLSLARRARRSSLGLKLAALGAAAMAGVVAVTFWALGVEIRANTLESFAREMQRNQRVLQELQQANARELLFATSLISQSPAFQYSLQTYQAEVNAGGRPDARLVGEIEDQLRRLVHSVNGDLLVVTDDSGRVFASVGEHGAAVPRGFALRDLQALRHALDPNAPADSGGLAVLRTGAGHFQVAVYPLVQDGFTLGALVLGQRLDAAFVEKAHATSDASIVLMAGSSIIGASDSTLAQPATGAVLATRALNDEHTVRLGDEDYVVAAVVLGETQDLAPVRLWMVQSLTRRVNALTRPLREKFLIYGLVAVLVAAIGAALVARTVLGPFQRFVRYMRSSAVTEQREHPFDADAEALEVRTLNDSFDHLMDSLGAKRRDLEARTAQLTAANVVLTDEINERIRVEQALRESEAQLRQSQKLEAIGTLAGGIAHDFNNLITVISGYTQLALMRAERDSPAAEDLKQVVEASDRAATLTHQLLAFSRKQVLQPTVLDLDNVVRGIAPMLRRIIGEHIELVIDSNGPLARVRADKGQLEQVLLNLAVNARDAMASGGGTVTIATSNLASRTEDTAGVLLTVTDTGTGMPADVRDRVFEPFFTTKEPGKGTGLGLSTVYGIVKQSGGSIAVESEMGVGTSFQITLPAVDMRSAVDGVAPPDDDVSTGTETVLIVEDADDVRILARRTLEARGYRVLTARGAEEALEISQALPIDVLLTDIVMPRISGPQLVAEYLATRPAPIVIYMSGYADDALTHYELDPGTVFLRKPFTPAVLARTLRRAIDQARTLAGQEPAGDVGSAAD